MVLISLLLLYDLVALDKSLLVLVELAVVHHLSYLRKPQRVMVDVVDCQQHVREHLVCVPQVVDVRTAVAFRAGMACAARENDAVIF